jgi:hypothetical protein
VKRSAHLQRKTPLRAKKRLAPEGFGYSSITHVCEQARRKKAAELVRRTSIGTGTPQVRRLWSEALLASAGMPSDTEFAPLRQATGGKLPPVVRVISMRLSFNPQPKREYVRSTALLDACRELACQHCGAAGPHAGVCAAHSNWGVHGKGKSIKADDNRVASLCFTCHSAIDQGSRLDEHERQELWWPAHVRTVALLVHLSLWPAGVPVPDTSQSPFELELTHA